MSDQTKIIEKTKNGQGRSGEKRGYFGGRRVEIDAENTSTEQ